VFLSTDIGTNWSSVNNGMTGNVVYSFAGKGDTIFAGTDIGLFFSTNKGTNWTKVLNSSFVITLAINGTNIFAGISNGGIYLSTNNGSNWATKNNGLTSNHIQSLAFCGSDLFAGLDSGVFLSTNNGTNWTKLNNGLTKTSVGCITVNGTNIFAATWPNGIFLSSNNGTDWIEVDEGLPYTATYLAICETDIFASTNGNGVFKRPLSEFPTDISTELNVLPQTYILYQNYPNPFNPSTTISYSLPSASNVRLIVYNTLGQTIKVLESGYKQSGNYSVNFNASDLPSGIYFYTIQTNSNDGKQNFTSTKKMILLK
jgi:hypothetical protein